MNRIFAVIVNFQSDDKVTRLEKNIRSAVDKTIVINNNKINRGFAKAVNLGIKQALAEKADSILLLNPDVAITPKQIAELTKTPGDIVGPVLTFTRQGKKIYDFGGKVNWLIGRTTHIEFSQGLPLRSKERPYEIDLDPQRSEDRNRERDYVSGACMLIDKKVFEKIGFFDEKFFLYFEDADFCLRAKKAGFKIRINPKVIVEHQISEHRFAKDIKKLSYILQSNKVFINKWIKWYFLPFSYVYFMFLKAKIIFNLSTSFCER